MFELANCGWQYVSVASRNGLYVEQVLKLNWMFCIIFGFSWCMVQGWRFIWMSFAELTTKLEFPSESDYLVPYDTVQ